MYITFSKSGSAVDYYEFFFSCIRLSVVPEDWEKQTACKMLIGISWRLNKSLDFAQLYEMHAVKTKHTENLFYFFAK